MSRSEHLPTVSKVEATSYAPRFHYTFCDTEYTDIASLANALFQRWEEGKKEVFSGKFSTYLLSYDQNLSVLAYRAEEIHQKYPQDADWIFLDLLYQLDEGLQGFFHHGRLYSFLDFGKELLQSLRQNDFSEYSFWYGLLRQRILSKYTRRIFGERNVIHQAEDLEKTSEITNPDDRSKALNAYALGYLLSDEIAFVMNNQVIRDVIQLTKYMKSLLDISYEAFEDFCHMLIDYNDVLDVQLEAFLIALGKQTELTIWRNGLN